MVHHVVGSYSVRMDATKCSPETSYDILAKGWLYVTVIQEVGYDGFWEMFYRPNFIDHLIARGKQYGGLAPCCATMIIHGQKKT